MITVLVVDDSAVDRKLAESCVAAQTAEAIFASNGVEALEQIKRHQPDAVLTDLQMPGMDGLDLVSQIKRDYPELPVIIMTAFGSEDIAVKALKCGAVSYVPKKDLKRGLGEALRTVRSTVEAGLEREQVRQFLKVSRESFVLGVESRSIHALVGYFQEWLDQFNFCDQSGRLQISTALTEALINAVDHGSLELDSELKEEADDAYQRLANERKFQSPYRERLVYVSAELTPNQVEFQIRDEGPGFDPRSIPDPTDPENLLRPSGRGILLIQTFMDEVQFNEAGNEIKMLKRRSSSSEY